MTPELLVALVGAVLSLLFAYFPWLKEQFDKVPSVWKPLLNAGILLVVALGLVGASCLGIVDYFACSLTGVLDAVWLWIIALVGNNLTYQYLVRQKTQQ
jgi:hypothetical protein